MKPVATLIICLLLTARTAAQADVVPRADLPPADLSLARELLSIYRGRSNAEIEALTSELENRNNDVQLRILKRKDDQLSEVVKDTWREGTVVRKSYRELLAVTQKYSGWARSAETPRWFDVPQETADEVLRKYRWEAIRPLLVPVSHDVSLFGWNDPDSDRSDWRERPDARLYELFMLLKWLDTVLPPDVKQFEREWVAKEAGADLVAAGTRIRETCTFLHGEYQFQILEPPELDVRQPRRVAAALRHVCWEQNSEDIDFATFVRQKDVFMFDLLSLVADQRGQSRATVDWFTCSARWYPFFTALEPVDTGNGNLEVFRARRAGPFPHEGGFEEYVQQCLSSCDPAHPSRHPGCHLLVSM